MHPFQNLRHWTVVAYFVSSFINMDISWYIIIRNNIHSQISSPKATGHSTLRSQLLRSAASPTLCTRVAPCEAPEAVETPRSRCRMNLAVKPCWSKRGEYHGLWIHLEKPMKTIIFTIHNQVTQTSLNCCSMEHVLHHYSSPRYDTIILWSVSPAGGTFGCELQFQCGAQVAKPYFVL